MSAIRRRFFRDDGQASLELVGSIWFMLFCALIGWQLLLVTASVTAAENAARNGARAASMGQGSQAAAISSLPGWLADGAQVSGGHHTTVRVQVPIITPGLRLDPIHVTREARMPPSLSLP